MKRTLIALLLATLSQQSFALVMAEPHRAVFEKGVTSVKINLVNAGTTPTTYRLAIRSMRMTADNRLEAVGEARPEDHFADQLLRVYPREVRQIAPKSGQVVSITLHKPADLPIGEYRTYLSITEVQPVTAETQTEAIGASVTPEVSVLIPLFVRQGQIEGAARFDKIQVGKDSLKLDLVHAGGEKSVFGDIHVYSGTTEIGLTAEIGLIAAIASYPDVPVRHYTVPLTGPATKPLRVTFEKRLDNGDMPKAPSVLFETDVK